MHLAINATEVGRQRGGNESYITGLVEGLAAVDIPLQVSLLTCVASFPAPASEGRFRRVELGPYRRLRSFLWQQSRALRRLQPDWYLANFFLPPALPCKGAVVVHDFSFRAHPEYFPAYVAWYMYWLTRWSMQRAQLVVTVSEFSRQEILRYCPMDERKIVMIPNGIGSEFKTATDEAEAATDRAVVARYGITPPYILALGNIHPRKNLGRLLEAYLLLRAQLPDAPTMVWSGASHWGSNALLERARAAGVVVTGFVAQEHLPALYRQALLLVYPSLYEGFGLPPLEAMACGTPVIASDVGGLSVLVQHNKTGLRVRANDPAELARAIERLLDDDALRRRMGHAAALSLIHI